jgi:hypothetical protein
MSEVIRQLQSWLTRSGWAVAAQRTRPADEPSSVDHLLTVEATQPPLGVKVELNVRVFEYHRFWETEEILIGVTVRYPPLAGASGTGPQVYLTAAEAQLNDRRQLGRVLSWFHEPCSAVLWEEQPGDWMPPAGWEAEEWAARATIDQRWHTCAEPVTMLAAIPGRPDDRKLQLLACAFCRLLPLAMHHERNRLAVDATERYALGQIPRREMKKVCKHSDLPWLAQLDPLPLAQRAIRRLIEDRPSDGPRLAADVIRDVMGDPFRPVALRHTWLKQEGGVVRHLVESIVADGRFDDLPILADALEDAGCIEPRILDHCRGAGPHVRGCWAIDLLRPPERSS